LLLLLSLAIVIYRTNGVGKSPTLVYSSPVFLSLTLLGLALCYSSLFGWMDKPTKFKCQWRIWPSTVGFFIAYGAVLVKTWRLWRLFSISPKLRTKRITNEKLLGFMSILIALQLLLLALWTGIDPLKPVSLLDSSGTAYYLTCGASNNAWIAVSLAYMGAVVVASGFFTFVTRKLPDSFKEAYYINLISYNTLFIGVVTIVLCVVLRKLSILGEFLVISLGIIFMTSIFWVLLFVPKLYVVVLRPEKDKKYDSQVSGYSRGASTDSLQMSSINGSTL